MKPSSGAIQEEMAFLQHAMHVGSWYWNIQTGEKSWSDEYYRIFGLLPKDGRLNATSDVEFIHPDDRERALGILNLAIASQMPYHDKKRIVRPDGTVRHIIVNGKVIYDDEGRPQQMFGSVQDITDQKNSQKQFLEKEERSRAILKAIPDLIVVFNKQGFYLYAKAPDSMILPLPPDELIGKYVGDVLPKKVSDKILAAFTTIEKTKQSHPLEYSVSVAGCLRYYETRITAKGTGIFLAIVRDITKKKTIEKELKKSKRQLSEYARELEGMVVERTSDLNEMIQKLTTTNLNLEDQIMETKEAESIALSRKQLLHSIAENFPRGFVAVVDSNFKIVFIEGEEIDALGFKYLAKEGADIDLVKRVPGHIKTRVKKNIQKTLQGGSHSFEISFQNRSYAVNTAPLYDKDKNITQVLLVHNNISSQKQVEQHMLNSLKREQELGKLKSRFLSMASHEFRTPLSTILSAANLIERQNESGKEQKRIAYVERIKLNVKNLVVVLNDFLSLSKLQEGMVVPQPSGFDIVDFTKSLIDEIQGIKKKGQTITLKTDLARIDVFLDPKLLRHITYNLLSNAIKYSGEGKRITLTIHSCDTNIIVKVADEGIGVPVEDQVNLFKRFYRATNALNIQGTGLGLNIVKRYIELMGGNIGLESSRDQGAVFSVELPLYINQPNKRIHEKNTVNRG